MATETIICANGLLIDGTEFSGSDVVMAARESWSFFVIRNETQSYGRWTLDKRGLEFQVHTLTQPVHSTRSLANKNASNFDCDSAIRKEFRGVWAGPASVLQTNNHCRFLSGIGFQRWKGLGCVSIHGSVHRKFALYFRWSALFRTNQIFNCEMPSLKSLTFLFHHTTGTLLRIVPEDELSTDILESHNAVWIGGVEFHIRMNSKWFSQSPKSPVSAKIFLFYFFAMFVIGLGSRSIHKLDNAHGNKLHFLIVKFFLQIFFFHRYSVAKVTGSCYGSCRLARMQGRFEIGPCQFSEVRLCCIWCLELTVQFSRILVSIFNSSIRE
jgi:hypothetical protein